MGIDLGNLALDQATAVVTVLGQEAKVVYKPSVLTPRKLESIQKAVNDGDDLNPFMDFLSSVLVDWDVMKGGEKFPWDSESLKELPMVFIRALYMGILSDAGQGEAPKPSVAG